MDAITTNIIEEFTDETILNAFKKSNIGDYSLSELKDIVIRSYANILTLIGYSGLGNLSRDEIMEAAFPVIMLSHLIQELEFPSK